MNIAVWSNSTKLLAEAGNSKIVRQLAGDNLNERLVSTITSGRPAPGRDPSTDESTSDESSFSPRIQRNSRYTKVVKGLTRCQCFTAGTTSLYFDLGFQGPARSQLARPESPSSDRIAFA